MVTNGHTLFNDAFHAAQTNAQFILNQFPNGFNAAVSEVINIIRRDYAVVDRNHPADQAHDIVLRDGAVRSRYNAFQTELIVQFVPTDVFEVIMTWIEDLFGHISFCVINRGRFARA